MNKKTQQQQTGSQSLLEKAMFVQNREMSHSVKLTDEYIDQGLDLLRNLWAGKIAPAQARAATNTTSQQFNGWVVSIIKSAFLTRKINF